ncbi:hypothetical protein [Streptomyces sp. NPDC054756]
MPAEATGRDASPSAGHRGPSAQAPSGTSRRGADTTTPAAPERWDASPTGSHQSTAAQSAAPGAGIPSPAGTDRRGGDAASGYPSTAARRAASRNAGYHSAPAQSPSGTTRRGADTTTPAGAERRDAPPTGGYPSAPARPDAPSAPARPTTAPPAPGHAPRPPAPRQPESAAPAGRAHAETSAETTFRLRPVPSEPAAGGTGAPPVPPRSPSASPPPPRTPSTSTGVPFAPDPSLSWNAPTPPPPGRPVVSFGEPEGYDERARPRPLGLRIRPRIALAAACVVLGLGLIGGALTGSWLVGEPGDDGAQGTFAAAGTLWHSIPVDQLFPPTVDGKGAGPGGADRTWTRIAVAPDTGCANAFDPLLRKALSPAGCRRLLRATYIDATQSHVTTVGLLFTKADAATMRALDARFTRDGLDRRADLVPRPYAPKGTLAAGFGDAQRAAWTVSVLTDAPVVVYAVSGWADDRVVARPEPAEQAMTSGATSAVAQAGLGHEARGLADRVERTLRRNVGPSAEPSS